MPHFLDLSKYTEPPVGNTEFSKTVFTDITVPIRRKTTQVTTGLTHSPYAAEVVYHPENPEITMCSRDDQSWLV